MTPEQIARRYYHLFDDRRLDEAAAMVDGQASYHYLPTRQQFIGREGFHAVMGLWLDAFEDAQLQTVSALALNDHSVQLEFLGKGTHIHNGVIIGVEPDFDVEEMKRRLLG